MTESKEHRTVSRIATILERVAASEPEGLPLIALAARLDAPKSSVHDLVRGLEAIGYLTNEAGSYRIGPAPAALLNRRPADMLVVAKPEMERLLEAFHETVCLSELVGDTCVYRTMLDSKRAIRYSAPLGERNPLYPRSAGKAFLAAMTDRKRNAYVSTKFDAAEQPRILEDLSETRVRGCSRNFQAAADDLSAVAGHVGFLDGTAWAISVARPPYRIESRSAEIESALLDSVERLAAELNDRSDYRVPPR